MTPALASAIRATLRDDVRYLKRRLADVGSVGERAVLLAALDVTRESMAMMGAQ